MIHKKKGNVRSIDIVNELDLSKPSVSVAMKNLRENGYILMDSVTGFISLTDKGTEIAEKMYERHTLLSEFLVHLGVDPETAPKMPAAWNTSSAHKPLTRSKSTPNTGKTANKHRNKTYGLGELVMENFIVKHKICVFITTAHKANR